MRGTWAHTAVLPVIGAWRRAARSRRHLGRLAPTARGGHGRVAVSRQHAVLLHSRVTKRRIRGVADHVAASRAAHHELGFVHVHFFELLARHPRSFLFI